jgi:hypothetical protein
MRSRFDIERPKLHSVERGDDFDFHEGDALAFLPREANALVRVLEGDDVMAAFKTMKRALDNAGISPLIRQRDSPLNVAYSRGERRRAKALRSRRRHAKAIKRFLTVNIPNRAVPKYTPSPVRIREC